jgi:disulfide bond formation protein DsbB
MAQFQRLANILFIYVLSGVLLGAYAYQYIKNEDPCPLCLLQRLGMIGVGAAILLNLRFGIKAEHYGLAILSAMAGRVVALRQISMHICSELPPLGETVFGFDLYVWSYIVFSCCIFSCATLLIIYGFAKEKEAPPVWGRGEKSAFLLLTLISIGSVVTTWAECGLFSSC